MNSYCFVLKQTTNCIWEADRKPSLYPDANSTDSYPRVCTAELSEVDHPTSTHSAPEQKIRQIIFTIDALDAKEPDKITSDSTSTFSHPREAVKVCGLGPIRITQQKKNLMKKRTKWLYRLKSNILTRGLEQNSRTSDNFIVDPPSTAVQDRTK